MNHDISFFYHKEIFLNVGDKCFLIFQTLYVIQASFSLGEIQPHEGLVLEHDDDFCPCLAG